MSLEDLSSVTALAAQLGYPGSKEEIQSRFATISSKLDSILLVAEENEEILGWIYLGSVTPLTSPPRAQIWGLVVSESSRQKGIGKKLVNAGENWAQESLGVKTIGVGSNQNRSESHPFYKKLGYLEKKKWIVYQKQLGEM